MKTSIILAVGLLAVFVGLLICLRQFCVEKPPPIVVSSSGPTIDRLEKLSQLVTSRVYVADVLIGEGSGCRGAFLIRGDALLAIPLNKASVIDKDESTKRATIRLPPPERFFKLVSIIPEQKRGRSRPPPGYRLGLIKITFATRSCTRHNSWSPRPPDRTRISSRPSVPPRSSSRRSTSTSGGK